MLWKMSRKSAEVSLMLLIYIIAYNLDLVGGFLPSEFLIFPEVLGS